MGVRTKLYNVIGKICPVEARHDLPPTITKNMCVIKRKSANESFDNTLAGWNNWIIYVFSPNSPLDLDLLMDKIRDALYKNNIEITHDMSDDEYDEDLKAYVCTITCRTPDLFDKYI